MHASRGDRGDVRGGARDAMNTDETTTNQSEATPPERSESQGSQPEQGSHSQPEQGNDASTTPAVEAQPDPAPPQRAREESEEPGDDIGNRVAGGGVPDDIGNRLPGAGRPHGAQATGDAPAKKRRRRRRKKGPPGAEGAVAQAEGAEGAEGEEHEGEEGEEHAEGEAHAEGEEGAEGEGGEKKKRRGKPGPAADRDRPAFSIGEEVFGKVSKVTETAVWIDIAGKATGLFDRRELVDEEPPVEGDQFIATVASTGVRGGMLMLSRLPIILEETKKALEAASQSGEAVMGFVTGAVKGGLEVDLGGLRAFAPASHVDLRHGADLNYLVGQHLDFVVTQYAKKGRDIVVSRKKFLEEESKKLRAEALAKVEAGSVHKGIVRKVVQWGAFIALPDAGGVEGLVHMTEASHDRGARLSDIFKQGAEIEVKVLKIDDKGKLWLSRKALVADPWDTVKDKYPVGSRHKGKVARLQPFGAFIELESGIDGLVHTADLSLKPINHPEEVVKVGEEIEVIVASCDPGAHKIGLHPAPPPGEEAEPRQRVAPHKIVKVAVAQITEGGLVVRILGATGRSSRGFIPAGHTGTPRGTDLRKEFPVGTQLEAKVIEIDPRRGEAKLSIRAVKEDAEKHAYQQYRAGVAREAKFGTFADLMKKSS
ncbi:SSU ribosomal protein S1p [Minicystis rosea]|nr:SSU ribosomal protein S1p [Minicystis rosea]